MSFRKYQKFSEIFYLIILTLTIPFYVVLHGASGHAFRLEPEVANWMILIVATIVLMITYLVARRFVGLGEKIIRFLFGLISLVTLYGGLKVSWFILSFDYGNDIGPLTRIILYAIPVVFIYSNLNIILGLFRPKKGTDTAVTNN